jgi:membrane protein implicated in regulation of membrane protease activity
MQWQDLFEAPGYWLSRVVFVRGLGAIYLIAFLVTVNQFRPLLGEHGLLPAPDFLGRVPFRRLPSLFHVRYSDRLLLIAAWTGVLLSAAVVVGLVDAAPLALWMLVWFVMWVLYLSIVNIGQTFYAFGWESLLLEAGFFAIFLGPAWMAPFLLVIWMIRWLLFRVEFGAGLIKIRGDPCWRDLTCLYYHHETQPMPNPLSRYFHHLPHPLHRVEVLGNHFAQLVAPLGLAFPQPVSDLAGVVIVVTQGWLVLSGNFSWLNAVTILCAVAAFDNGALSTVLPVQVPSLAAPPFWYQAVIVALTAVVLVLSYWPARNLVSRRQLMNYSFNPFHLVNAYGAFGSVTRVRFEIIIEGTTASDLTESVQWSEYEFKGKPGDPRRIPPQIAPYHLRLDWLMWFAAMSTPLDHPWFVPLLIKLLEEDPPTLNLLRRNPFPHGPPAFIRARLYRYRFSTGRERRETGNWWIRELVGDYVPPARLASRE